MANLKGWAKTIVLATTHTLRGHHTQHDLAWDTVCVDVFFRIDHSWKQCRRRLASQTNIYQRHHVCRFPFSGRRLESCARVTVSVCWKHYLETKKGDFKNDLPTIFVKCFHSAFKRGITSAPHSPTLIGIARCDIWNWLTFPYDLQHCPGRFPEILCILNLSLISYTPNSSCSKAH